MTRVNKIKVDGDLSIPVIVEQSEAMLIGQGATDAYVATIGTMFKGYLEWREHIIKHEDPSEDVFEAIGCHFGAVVVDMIKRTDFTNAEEVEAFEAVLSAFQLTIEAGGMNK